MIDKKTYILSFTSVRRRELAAFDSKIDNSRYTCQKGSECFTLIYRSFLLFDLYPNNVKHIDVYIKTNGYLHKKPLNKLPLADLKYSLGYF